MRIINSACLIVCGTLLAQAPVDPMMEGPRIIGEAFSRLSAALAEAIARDGAAGALRVCSEQAPRIAREVGEANGVILRRASEKPRNPRAAPDEVEKAALADFAKALAAGETPKARLSRHEDGSASFLAPIVLANSLCLQCHGQLDRDVAPETQEALKKWYPDDKATGYQLNDLRGLWRVIFPAVNRGQSQL